jgi:predicted DNA-binding transcriptional regulator AlpA
MKLKEVEKAAEEGQAQEVSDKKKRKKHSKSVLDTVEHFDHLPTWARVSPTAVALIFGISMATYWRRVAAGEIPKPTQLFGRSVSNTVGEIRALGRKEV